MAGRAKVAEERYGTATIALHWLTLLLIGAVYATINLRELFPRGSDPREALKLWHFMLGLSVLVFVLLRLVASIDGPRPVIMPQPPAWQRGAAVASHWALYAFMVAMPLAGWATLSAAGDPIPFFGFTLPPLVAESPALADRLEDLHKLGGTVGYYLIGLHAAAALFHHYYLRDNALVRMLPRRT